MKTPSGITQIDGHRFFVGPQGSNHIAIKSLIHNSYAGVIQVSENWDRVLEIVRLLEDIHRIELHQLATAAIGPITSFDTVFFNKSDQKDQVRTRIMKKAQTVCEKDSVLGRVSIIAEEMLFNALFNAPTDSQGTPLFSDKNRNTEVVFPKDHQAEMFIAYNEHFVTLFCRDSFGSLNLNTFRKKLNRSYHDDDTTSVVMDDNVGGAGIGTRLIIDNSLETFVAVDPGRSTAFCSILPVKMSVKKFDESKKNIILLDVSRRKA